MIIMTRPTTSRHLETSMRICNSDVVVNELPDNREIYLSIHDISVLIASVSLCCVQTRRMDVDKGSNQNLDL